LGASEIIYSMETFENTGRAPIIWQFNKGSCQLRVLGRLICLDLVPFDLITNTMRLRRFLDRKLLEQRGADN